MLASKSKNLEALTTLEDGWDSYGGKKPTDAALRTASEVYFVPVNDGGVQIEMHSNGLDIEICIAPDGAVSSVMTGRA